MVEHTSTQGLSRGGHGGPADRRRGWASDQLGAALGQRTGACASPAGAVRL